MLKGNSFVLASIGAFIFLVFAYGRMGQIPFDKSVLIVLAVFLMLYSARAFEVEMKYRSPKFVSDPVHSTANWSDVRLIGNYAVIKLGAFDAYGFKYKGGNEGTAIIRLDSLTKTGESVVSTAKISQISWDELPPEVYKEKDYLGLTEPLYRGDLGNSEGLKQSEYGKLEIEMKGKDKLINMLQELGEGNMDVVEKYVEGSSRIIERRKGVGAFLKGIFTEDKRDNRGNEEQ